MAKFARVFRNRSYNRGWWRATVSIQFKMLVKACSGEVIAVHDAVRPNLSPQLIKELFTTAEITGAVIPVIAIKDSLREITFDESKAVDREQFRLVQTPQVFKAHVLKLAYEQDYNDTFTDDATVVESCGQDIALIDGEEGNIQNHDTRRFKVFKLFDAAKVTLHSSYQTTQYF